MFLKTPLPQTPRQAAQSFLIEPLLRKRTGQQIANMLSADEYGDDNLKQACWTTKLPGLGLLRGSTFHPCEYPLAHITATPTQAAIDAKETAEPRGLGATHPGGSGHQRQRQPRRAGESRLLFADSR